MRRMKSGSIRFNLVFRISILFIAIILASSSVIVLYMTERYNKTILENMDYKIDNIVHNVDYYFDDVKTPMTMLARNKTVAKSITKYYDLSNRGKLDVLTELDSFVQNIETFKEFIADIIIVGNNGFVYNIYDENADKYLKDYDFLNSDYLEEAVSGKIQLYYYGEHTPDYYLENYENRKVYSVILPIRNGRDKKGYVICDLDAEIINKSFVNLLDNNESKVAILNGKGDIIFEDGSEKIEESEMQKYDNRKKHNIFEVLFEHGNYLTYVKSAVTGWTYVYAETYDNFNGLMKQIFYFTAALILLGELSIIFISRQISYKILKPMRDIAFSIKEMQVNNEEFSGDIGKRINQGNIHELSIEIEKMLHQMDRLISENYMYALKMKESQIQMLEDQLSPHFLYNTLQLIEYQCYHGTNENVSTIIGALSNILRYSLSKEKETTLEAELNYIQSYLRIYALRFENELYYDIRTESVYGNIKMPKMILEPLVNNCIKHGFLDLDKSKQKKIIIAVNLKETYWEIAVEDNGKGIVPEQLKEMNEHLQENQTVDGHIGLYSVNSILKLRYGIVYGVTVQSKEGYFTKVSLKLPLNSME